MKTNNSLILFVLLTLFSSVLWSEEGGVPSNLSEATKLEFERLEAQIQKQQDEYQKRPKTKHIGARTKENRFAIYVENWSKQVEKVGNDNYPVEAKNNNVYGKLSPTVCIKQNGELDGIEINKSSGHNILDEYVLDTIKKSAPFEPFSEEIKKDTDILCITRTWTFAPDSGN